MGYTTFSDIFLREMASHLTEKKPLESMLDILSVVEHSLDAAHTEFLKLKKKPMPEAKQETKMENCRCIISDSDLNTLVAAPNIMV